MLRHLARVSLLIPLDDGSGRWSILDPVRELASLELETVGESEVMIARHRRWYAEAVEGVEDEIGRTGRPDVMRDLDMDHDNVRRAIDSAVADADGDLALRLTAAMAPFWTAHGDWTEGRARLRTALRCADPINSRTRRRALVALATLLLIRGDLAEANDRFAEVRGLATAAADESILARALDGLGYLAFRRSDLDEAKVIWTRALVIAERAGDDRVCGSVLRSLAVSAGSAGDQDQARRLLDRGIILARRSGDDRQLRLLLGSVAEVDLWLGNYRAAQDAYGDALALAAGVGDVSARPSLLAELGWLALMRGELGIATRLGMEAADLAKDLVNRRVWAHALRLTGEVLVRQNDVAAASVALEDALAVADRSGAPTEIAGIRLTQAYLAVEDLRPADACHLLDLSTVPIPVHAMRVTSPRWIRGMFALAVGDLDRAEREFRTDLDAARAGRAVRHEAMSLDGIARIRIALGDRRQAARFQAQALERRWKIHDHVGVVESLVAVAGVAGVSTPDKARRLLDLAERLLAECGGRPTRRQGADIAVVRSVIGDDRLEVVVPGPQPGLRVDVNAAVGLAFELAERVGGRIDPPSR